MAVIWTVVTVVLAVCGSQVAGDANNKWRKNDDLLKHIRDFYFSLPVYAEDAINNHKRFAAVVSLASFFYGVSNITDNDARVMDAVEKTKQQLSQPSDVITSPKRTVTVFISAIIQQPAIDVQTSCPRNRSQESCDSRLHRLQEKHKQRCQKYSRNIDVYNLVTDSKNTRLTSRFLTEFKLAGGNDEAALNWFKSAASSNLKDFYKFLGEVYAKLLKRKYPCTSPIVLS